MTTTTVRLAPYCVGCLPGLHAPLYAAVATGAFRDVGIAVELWSPAPRQQRLDRLRRGEVDLALIDLASLVDAHAVDPRFDARCVFVLTQRLPMAAHVLDRPDGTPIATVDDLATATYGGTHDSSFVAEHRALLRRLGHDDPGRLVDMGYEHLFDALAAQAIDVAPDFAGTRTRFRRAAAPRDTRVVRYRDCGVRAYGIGFVASGAGLRRHPTRMQAVATVLGNAYRRMREDPAGVIDDAARLLPDIDRAYALAEWEDEEAAVVFGYDATTSGIGTQDASGWTTTVAWRHEVTGHASLPTATALFEHP